MTILRRPDHVAMVDVHWDVEPYEDETAQRPTSPPLYLGTLPHGPLLILEDTAALIYRSCLDSREESVVSAVADTTGQDPSAITDDVRHFVADLLTAGVLERVPG